MAKYTVVGPYAFKRSAKKPNSVKALRPVASPSETRRAFSSVNIATHRQEAKAESHAARVLAERQRKLGAIRSIYGGNKLGAGSGKNPLMDLISGRSRLTTPQERSQTVPGRDYLGRPTGQKIHPYGLTTLDEGGQQLRRASKAEAQRQKDLSKFYGSSASQGGLIGGLAGAVVRPVLTLLGDKQGLRSLNKTTRSISDPTTKAVVGTLDQFSRPYHGVNAGAKAALQHKNVPKAAAKGLKLQDRTESWDVLDAAGVKNKKVKYGVGVPLSWLSDPTTYASVLAAPVSDGASLAAEAPKAQRSLSLIRGALTLDKAANAAAKASRAEKEAALVGKTGLKLGFRARLPLTQKALDLRTSGRTTAKVGQSRVAQRIANSAPVRGVRNDFDATYREGADASQKAAINTATRRMRAAQHQAGFERKQTEKELRNAIRQTLGISKAGAKLPRGKRAIAAEDRRLFSEGERIGPKTKVGSHVEDLMRQLRAKEIENGVPTPKLVQKAPGDAAAYLPRYQLREVEKNAHKAFQKQQRKLSLAPRISSRINPERPASRIDELRPPVDTRTPKGTPTDIAQSVIANVPKRVADSRLNIARAQFSKALASTGVKVSPGEVSADHLQAGEAVFVHHPDKPWEGLTEVKGNDLRRFEEGKGAAGASYVVAKRKLIEGAKASARESQSPEGTSATGRFFDRATGKWKGLVTVASPSYYGRNAIGDLMLGHQADTSASDLVNSARIAHGVHKANRIKRSGKTITEGKDAEAALKKIKVKIGDRTYSGKDLEDLATEHGAVGGGTIGGEVSQLVGSDSLAATNPLARANVSRENWPRRATMISAMKRGDSPAEAAAYSAKHHFDYGDLTQTERKLRRVVPFYSFWSKNTRKQLHQLVERPGKTSQIYHVMNAAASAAGFQDYRDYVSQLPEAQQRGLPVPVKVGGKIKNVQFGNVLTDLQVLTPNVVAQADNALGRTNPFLKTPLEILGNYSTFYRDKIAPDYAPDTKAPSVIPKQLLSKYPLLDRKSGKYNPAYNKKVAYALQQLGPQAALLLGMSTKGEAGPFQQSATDQLIGLTGLRPNTFYAEKGQLDKLYKQRGKLLNKRTAMANHDVPPADKTKLNAQITDLTNQIQAIEQKAGYKKPLGLKGGSTAGPSGVAPSGGGGIAPTGPKGVAPTSPQGVAPTAKKAALPSIAKKIASVEPSLDKTQRNIVAQIISIGKKRHESPKEIQAALATGRVEANFTNPKSGDADSQGWRQERAGIYKDPTNLTASINRFYDETSKAGNGKGMSAGQLAAAVQRPAAQYRGRYQQNLPEAKMLLAAAKGSKLAPQTSHQLGEALIKAAASRATKIASREMPYLWGGGHAGNATDLRHYKGPLDCSGAVSKVLGIDPRVASQFETIGKPGASKKDITIYAKDTHVLMYIPGKGLFGTSGSNKGGGANFIDPKKLPAGYLNGFTARHIPRNQKVGTNGQPGTINWGNQTFATGGSASSQGLSGGSSGPSVGGSSPTLAQFFQTPAGRLALLNFVQSKKKNRVQDLLTNLRAA